MFYKVLLFFIKCNLLCNNVHVFNNDSKEIKNPKNLCEMLSRENYNSSLQDFEAEIKKKNKIR